MAVTQGFPEEVSMHFIEQFFGFAPDGGSGSLELVLLAFVSLLAIGWRRGQCIDSRELRNGPGYKQ